MKLLRRLVKYILTQAELDALVPLSEHLDVKEQLEEAELAIERMRHLAVPKCMYRLRHKDIPEPSPGPLYSYCDQCPLEKDRIACDLPRHYSK